MIIKHGQTGLRNPRIILYSHDTLGLGHVRRNLLIAQVLATSRFKPNILLISGAWEAGSFAMPYGVDSLILPAWYKELSGSYRARRLIMSLEEFAALRKKIIVSAVAAFEPDCLIVDNVPRGCSHELDDALEYAHSHKRIHCILGLRDILDEDKIVHQQWRRHHNLEAIRRYYDAVWVYGDPLVFDVVKEYGFPSDIAAKIRYTGYMDQRVRLNFAKREGTSLACPDLGIGQESFVLCMVGGGQDGYPLAEAFSRATFPERVKAVLVTGPHMELKARKSLLALAAKKPAHSLRIFEFIPEPACLMQQADCVIAMGGYNTVSEVLSFGRRTLIVPRTLPRKEQLIRAQHFKDLAVLDMMYPDELSPARLSGWIAKNINQPAQDYRRVIDMNGLARLPELVKEFLR